jgi:glyoxylase-like metal-dependent hydrolase (beta-lactamase superfamily II)
MNPRFLHAGNPGPLTGDGNWTYLIDGDRPVLIDAGVGTPSHLEAIDAAVGARDLHLVVTHAHSDHIAGAPAITERRPSTRLSKMPWPIRDRDLPWQPLAHGDIVPTGEGDLEVLHTPGHAPDHVCLWHAQSRTIFVGDMLVKGSTVVIPASHGGSVASYLHSLAMLLALDPRRALPAHGPVIEDPRGLMHSYIQHRRQREVEIFDAVAGGAATVDELLARVYPTLQPALESFARESILAHLIKLEDEGRIRRDDTRWRPVY